MLSHCVYLAWAKFIKEYNIKYTSYVVTRFVRISTFESRISISIPIIHANVYGEGYSKDKVLKREFKQLERQHYNKSGDNDKTHQ